MVDLLSNDYTLFVHTNHDDDNDEDDNNADDDYSDGDNDEDDNDDHDDDALHNNLVEPQYQRTACTYTRRKDEA